MRAATRTQPVELSTATIEAVEGALFSSIAEANTQLRNTLACEWSSGEMWARRRTEGLVALREILLYAEGRYLKSPGLAESLCNCAANYFNERG